MGTWHVTNTCLQAKPDPNSTCPGLTTDSTGAVYSGTVTYNADKTYSRNLTSSGTIVLNVPASCLVENGVTLTCAQLQQEVTANLATSAYSSGTCADSNGGCACTMQLKSSTSVGSGTYTTSGGLLAQTETGSTAAGQIDYCVSGSMLTFSQRPNSPLTGSLVFAK